MSQKSTLKWLWSKCPRLASRTALSGGVVPAPSLLSTALTLKEERTLQKAGQMRRTPIEGCPVPADAQPHTEEQGAERKSQETRTSPVECVSYKWQGSHAQGTLTIGYLNRT